DDPRTLTAKLKSTYIGLWRADGESEIWVKTPDLALHSLDDFVLQGPMAMSCDPSCSNSAATALNLLIDAVGEELAACPRCWGGGYMIYNLEKGTQRPCGPDEALEDFNPAEQVFTCQSCSFGYRELFHEEFIWEVVANWGDEWSISRAEVLTWLAEQGK
ncbi:MAG: hypothetical protein ACREN8_10260, partial [Candidatus Dormibacteraceae bacterium]